MSAEAAAPPVEPAAVETPPVSAPVEAPPAAPAEDVASLPEWAQKLLTKTRGEAASHRTKANDSAQALEATRDAIAKALGLKDDDDPVTAAKTAAEEREAARTVAKNLAVENAVLRQAAKHSANPDALTDSRSFMRELEALDPDDAEFAAKVGVAIETACKANPLLKTALDKPAPRSGGPVGGGPGVPGQLKREDLAGMAPEAIEEARVAGRLNNLLGIS